MVSSPLLKLLTKSASKIVSSTLPAGFAPGSPGCGYTDCCVELAKLPVYPEVTVLEALQDIYVAVGEWIPVMFVMPVTPAELVDIDLTVDPITVSDMRSDTSS